MQEQRITAIIGPSGCGKRALPRAFNRMNDFIRQAARVSDFTAFLENGVLKESGETDQVFTRPKHRRTEEYVTGRFG